MGKQPIQFLPKASGSIIKFKHSSLGFTLVELLIALVMLSVMISLVILFIDPVKQLEKGKDAKREQDLKQIVNALDTYYNDNNMYPVSLSFGNAWLPYMQKIPQDPNYSVVIPGYGYMTDSTSLQWNILFAKINKVGNYNSTMAACKLPVGCFPRDYDSSQKYNYCLISGTLDDGACSYITNNDLP